MDRSFFKKIFVPAKQWGLTKSETGLVMRNAIMVGLSFPG